MKKRLLIILLTACLSLSFSSCGKSKATQNIGETPKEMPAETTENVEISNDELFADIEGRTPDTELDAVLATGNAKLAEVNASSEEYSEEEKFMLMDLFNQIISLQMEAAYQTNADEGLTYVEPLLEFAPDNSALLSYMGFAYAEKGDTEKSEACYNRIDEISAMSPEEQEKMFFGTPSSQKELISFAISDSANSSNQTTGSKKTGEAQSNSKPKITWAPGVQQFLENYSQSTAKQLNPDAAITGEIIMEGNYVFDKMFGITLDENYDPSKPAYDGTGRSEKITNNHGNPNAVHARGRLTGGYIFLGFSVYNFDADKVTQLLAALTTSEISFPGWYGGDIAGVGHYALTDAGFDFAYENGANLNIVKIANGTQILQFNTTSGGEGYFNYVGSNIDDMLERHEQGLAKKMKDLPVGEMLNTSFGQVQKQDTPMGILYSLYAEGEQVEYICNGSTITVISVNVM